MSEVGFGRPGRRVEKKVEVELGSPTRLTEKIIIPFSWHATGLEALFPVLDADFEVAPLGQGRTQLALSGRYQPPLGSLGQALDRALLHRVAEATVKDFLDRVAERVDGLIQGGDTG